MSTRRIALTSIAVVTVLCVVGVAILAVAAGGSALAYQVNGTRVSQQTVDDQLKDIAESKGVNASVRPTPGSVNSTVAATILTNNILRDLLKDAADRKGVKLTAADKAAGTSSVKSQLGANFDRVPASYRDVLVETYGYANALGLTGSSALSSFAAREVKHADIYVNPRYGHWNPKFGVCPPTGCQALSQSPSGG
jgi:hypothetical protein